MRILLTDGLQRKTLAAARALGRQGELIFVSEYTRVNPTRFSKYIVQHIQSPNPHSEGDLYMSWLCSTIDQYRIDLVIPMDDATMSLCVKHQSQLAEKCTLLVPNQEAYAKASDKKRAVQQALIAGVNCPRSYDYEGVEELERLKSELIYPIILKPRHNAGSRGIQKLWDFETLQIAVQKSYDREGQLPLIQAYIEQGRRVDVCLLYDRQGLLVAGFTQEEIRQYPEPMGPSTVQRSIPCGEIAEQAHGLMSSLGWVGIAEVEFMESPIDGQLYFMEINTRFWASLQCAIYSGVNFPVLYKSAALGSAEPLGLATPYTEGLYCRWLWPGDILRLLSKGWRSKWTPSFFSGRREGIYDDIYDPEDWGPVVGVLATMIRFSLDLNMWKSYFWR